MVVAVLGAGIVGSLTALELANSGREVVLFERNGEALTEASLINEGKIHRGFVYAADSTFRTAQVMLKGAERFEAILSRFLPRTALETFRTDPFEYLVHRDSMVPIATIETHFRRIAESPPRVRNLPVWQRLPREVLEEHYNPDFITAAYSTDEIAIDPHGIAGLLRMLLRNTPRLTLRTSETVVGVKAQRKGYVVCLKNKIEDGPFTDVVNALWANRWIADRRLGRESLEPSVTRVKLGVSLCSPVKVPTFTVMLGPFGDVVQYPSGRIYFSWYPDCMVGAIKSNAMQNWESLLDGLNGTEIAERSFSALAQICPPLITIPSHIAKNIAGGAIVAFGQSDIDDPESKLHQRYQVGVSSWGNYHSVNTGKYTLGPILASCVAQRVIAAHA